jgi:hypothetical protein
MNSLFRSDFKTHLAPNFCVTGRAVVPLHPRALQKMLTYFRVRCAFSSASALNFGAIWGFEATSN